MGITIHESIFVLPNFLTAKVLWRKENTVNKETEYYPDGGDVTSSPPLVPLIPITRLSD